MNVPFQLGKPFYPSLQVSYGAKLGRKYEKAKEKCTIFLKNNNYTCYHSFLNIIMCTFAANLQTIL